MRYFVLYSDFQRFLNIQCDSENLCYEGKPMSLLHFSAGTPPHAATQFALVSCHAAYYKCQKLSDTYCHAYLCGDFSP